MHLQKADIYEAEFQNKTHLVEQFLQEHIEDLSIIPSQYWYPDATSFLVDAIQTGRAISLSEAIDQLEEWLYNQNEEFEDQQENEADTVSAGEIIAETAKLVWDIHCIWTDDDYYYYNDD